MVRVSGCGCRRSRQAAALRSRQLRNRSVSSARPTGANHRGCPPPNALGTGSGAKRARYRKIGLGRMRGIDRD
eukprot:5976280-Pyramimonas_sp.AAC.1